MRRVLFTDGIKYVADNGGAYWLVDEIVFAQVGSKAVAAEAFQLWKLTVRPDHTATLTCKDGNGNAMSTKTLDFTTWNILSTYSIRNFPDSL